MHHHQHPHQHSHHPLLSLGLGLLLLLAAASAAATESRTLIPQLEPFRPYLDTTWRGEFADSTPDKPVIDVSRWERALNGTAVRIMHSLNEGEYGGETIIFWDASRKELRYYYFTTAGFFTEGTADFDGNSFVSRESVTGNQQGIDEVVSTAVLDAEAGTMQVKSDYLKQGERVNGHETVYRRSPESKVVLR